MKLKRLLVTAALAASLSGVAAVPAVASDQSIDFYGAHATYDDLTDTLCVRADNDFPGLVDYAIGYIERPDGSIFASKFDYEGNGWSCTGNLSIPEDRLYYLRVSDCTDIQGTDCGSSRRKSFYS